MIRPPRGSCAFITRKAARAQRKAPVRLVSTTWRQASTSSSSSGPAGPERAGVVEQHVEPVEPGEQRLDRVGVADVGGRDGRALVARPRLLERLAAPPGEHDAVTGLQQAAGGGPADAGSCAGDEGDTFMSENLLTAIDAAVGEQFNVPEWMEPVPSGREEAQR